jgi:hypothetical protein
MRCIIHKWGKWSRPFKAARSMEDRWGGSADYEVTLQKRTCAKCGKVETRLVHGGIRAY